MTFSDRTHSSRSRKFPVTPGVPPYSYPPPCLGTPTTSNFQSVFSILHFSSDSTIFFASLHTLYEYSNSLYEVRKPVCICHVCSMYVCMYRVNLLTILHCSLVFQNHSFMIDMWVPSRILLTYTVLFCIRWDWDICFVCWLKIIWHTNNKNINAASWLMVFPRSVFHASWIATRCDQTIEF